MEVPRHSSSDHLLDTQTKVVGKGEARVGGCLLPGILSVKGYPLNGKRYTNENRFVVVLNSSLYREDLVPDVNR